MLSNDVKRKIDTCRDILVGKIPDPKSQVEQITIALMYKFMDDMDKKSQELGGKAKFFVGDYEKYAWTKIMDSRLTGQERLDLYAEAITKMSHNPHLPQLFRDIFKDAFLPYRSPETLNLFLKEINNFQYTHSEDLGNAYEYLLSIMGSQGEAGQFRTPRHIIDFIVEVVDPKKDESILDPACGTAGFLISSFKHIISQSKEKPLTPDEKKLLMNRIVGYDISPDMVRISKVNLYLHSFPTPNIYEYDTLTYEDRWDETYDVIVANPPFMTPKGGIKPHKRFAIQANRSEVLFVNYILEHLNIAGRAGIIVPEGIIFQSANAYKNLRKMLVEGNYLYAVVSLPAGVFQPYSGVKTSILFCDRQLAKQSDSILFVKVENDGYDLGAQRRKIDKDDLPLALTIINSYKRNIPIKNLPKTDELETLTKKTISIFVPKSKIRNLGDYYLTGDRYKEINQYKNQKWPMVTVGELCDLGRGRVINKQYIEKHSGPYPVYSSQTQNNGIFGSINTFDFEGEYVTWTTDGANAGTVFYRNGKFNCTNVCGTLKAKTDKVLMKYLALILNSVAYKYVIKVGNPKLMNNVMVKIKIPLPSLEVQKEIVAELENIEDEIKFNEKETKALKKLQNRIISNVWEEVINQNKAIPFMDKSEIESELRNIRELFNYMQNNQNNSAFIYFFESTILSLRELSYLIEKYFSDELNATIKNKISIITKARNAICHRSSPLNYVSIENRIKSVRNIAKGKCNLMKIGNIEVKSEFKDDIAVFYGNIRIYVIRDVKYLYDSFVKIITNLKLS